MARVRSCQGTKTGTRAISPDYGDFGPYVGPSDWIGGCLRGEAARRRLKPPRLFGVGPGGQGLRLPDDRGLVGGYGHFRHRHEESPQEFAMILVHGASQLGFEQGRFPCG